MKLFAAALTVAAFAWAVPGSGRAQDPLAHLQPPSPHVPFLPVDESGLDPSFKSLRDDLLAAVRDKDAKRILATFKPGIRALAGLEDSLRFADSPYWEDVERILSLGGSFTTTRGAVPGRREFCAPYPYSAYPSPYPRGFRGQDIPWVIVSGLALVRSRHDSQAPVLFQLSHELVASNLRTFPTDTDIPVWSGVILADGREGWVLATEIRNPSDYHICFAKFDGVWRMTTFEQHAPGQW